MAGTALTAFSVRRLRKEVIFWLPERHEWAVVHLTWRAETDDRWPTAELCPTWEGVISFLADSMCSRAFPSVCRSFSEGGALSAVAQCESRTACARRALSKW